VPAPYGVEQYNALADRRSLDFTVWYSQRTVPDRRWDVKEADWRFTGVYIEDPSRGRAGAARFAERCRAARPDLIVCLYHERPFVAGHPMLKALGIRVVLVVEASFDAWVRRSVWKEIAKSVLFRSADAAHAGPGAVAYARRYGFPQDRIFVVRLTTDVAHFGRALPPEGRLRLRTRLGVGGCVFLYVGRLWKPKGVLFLLEAFRQVRQRYPESSLLLVGDGVDESAIREAARGADGIVFWPFVQRTELPAYYAAADVFVFPTLGDPHGHVVEEAHAAGLPVVATDAAGDVRNRVKDEVSGFVVPAADSAALAERMGILAADAALRRSMGQQGRERVKAWGHETYVSEIERLVHGCLAAPRRATLAAGAMSALGHLMLQAAGWTGPQVQREFT